jgi:DNA-binding response OmpR family regulator
MSRRVAAIGRDEPFADALAAEATAAGIRFWRSPRPIEPSAALAMKLDAMVLDLATLERSGWPYLERICAALPEMGVLVCTEGATLGERLRGLRLGADGWLTKPTDAEEMIARAEAITRRRGDEGEPEGPLSVGRLHLRPAERRAFLGESDLALSRQEFDLLFAFARTDGEVVERGEIYRRAWGYQMAPGDRSVDTFVGRLRAKLAPLSPQHSYISTHFRVGYRFDSGTG